MIKSVSGLKSFCTPSTCCAGKLGSLFQKFPHPRYWHRVYSALIPWLNLCCATFSPTPFQLPAWQATRSHFHLSEFYALARPIACAVCTYLPSTVSLSPQQPVVCLAAPPSFAQHQLSQVLPECRMPYTPCITCTPLYRPGPSSRSWNFVCVAQHRRRGPVKRVECIALRCNAGHALRCKERGCGIRAMQNAVFYCAESS